MPTLVDISTIAAHLDVSVRHVRRLVAERRIPYVKWGNLLRFDPIAVSEWLNCNAIIPVEWGTARRRQNG
jgi:excisionase family DNA binding protein